MDVDASEIMLIVAGLVAFLVVYMYRKDDESTAYKLTVVLGLLAGIALLGCCAMWHDSLSTYDLIIVSVAAFALVIRPFRDTEFALIFAILAMIIVYVWMGDLSGDLGGLSEGWPRYVATFIAGAFVFMLLNFLQKLTQLFGKFLNLWPILFLLGLVCLVEGALLLSGNSSLFDYISDMQS